MSMNKNVITVSGTQGSGKSTLVRQLSSVFEISAKDLKSPYGMSGFSNEEYVVVEEAQVKDIGLAPEGDWFFVNHKGKKATRHITPKFVFVIST